MEDELVTESHGPSGFMYAAIFDGHAGFSSSQFLRHEVYKECVTALEGGALLESQDLSEAETAVTCAFLQADKRLLFMVSHGRVCGSLSVSRAFGDVPFKMMEEGIKDRHWTEAFASMKKLDGEWLVALPGTSHIDVDEDMEFIILASDGLWDSFKSADAVQFVQKKLKKHAHAQRASEEIAREALVKQSPFLIHTSSPTATFYILHTSPTFCKISARDVYFLSAGDCMSSEDAEWTRQC